MPDPKSNVKMTGDTHLPDTESEFSVEEANAQAAGTTGTPSDRGRGAELGNEGVSGRGGKKAGVLKDQDAKASDSPGETRDSGEGSTPPGR
jgi:hypothetical protein